VLGIGEQEGNRECARPVANKLRLPP
jgi:hypothetical protein